MSKAYTLLIFGVWVAVLPYLGFPNSWKNILITLSGLGLIGASYIFYQEIKAKEAKKGETFENFSENKFETKSEGEV